MNERIRTFKMIYPEEVIVKTEDYQFYTLIQVSDGSWYRQTDTVTTYLGLSK